MSFMEFAPIFVYRFIVVFFRSFKLDNLKSLLYNVK